MSNPIEVVLQFGRLINAGNAEGICSLMIADSEFVDSLGSRIQGTEKLRAAWRGYFKMVPDYSISPFRDLCQWKPSSGFRLCTRGLFQETASLRRKTSGARPRRGGP